MDLQRRCKNHSFATVRCMPRVDRHGFDVAAAVAKLSYVVDARGVARLVSSQHHLEDVGDGQGGVRAPADFAEEKPGTDVALIGTVYPSRAGLTQQTVWLQVGGYRKTSIVFGPRTYQARGSALVPGPADTLGPTPLVHALSWGGTDLVTKSAHPFNPIGRGFATEPLSLVGQPAHRIEPVPDPSGLSPKVEPWHAGFGPIPPWWEPRRSRSGTHDAVWARDRAPVRPVDFDPLHHSHAVPDLHFDAPLAPDVPIEVGGLTPEGIWRFKLPSYSLAFATRTFEDDGEDIRELETHLDSILVDADERRVDLSWRVALRLPRKWERMSLLVLYGVGEMPEEVFDAPAAESEPRAATADAKHPFNSQRGVEA
jgi:hypothetical protein